MKIFTLILGVSLTAAMGAAHAEMPAHGNQNGAHQMEMQSASQMKYAGTGVLKGTQANKIQIAHEPIAELKWPAMTMWFGLRDAPPKNIRVGDKVRFEMIQSDTKQWVIISIERM